MVGLFALAWAGGGGVTAAPGELDQPEFVGPTQILYADADTVYILRSLEWWSRAVPEREKLLLHRLRMRYWRDHLPPDMRLVFDTLGYPIGRVIHKPVGATEEWWTYRLLDPPIRFKDGVLLDRELFERYQAGR
jgi:hypothetical protein